MAKPLRPFVRGGGYYPSKKWIPLVRNGGYTTQNGGETEPVWATASGAIASFTTPFAYPLKKLVAQINPVQDLHGYANPWPAGGGKNLFNPDFENTTINGTTITKLSDGKITTSGVPTAPFDFIIGHFALAAGTYILNGAPADGGSNKWRLQVTDYPVVNSLGQDNGNGVTFTLASDMEIAVRLQMYVGASASLTFAPMIRLPSVSDATFAPYSNICPISGWTGLQGYNDPAYGGLIQWNQIIQNGDFASSSQWTPYQSSYVDLGISDNVATATAKAAGIAGYLFGIGESLVASIVSGHKYFVQFDVKSSIAMTPKFELGGAEPSGMTWRAISANTWSKIAQIATPTNIASRHGFMLKPGGNQLLVAIGDTFQYKNVIVLDLTEMFGDGNEPPTVDDVQSLFPHDYYQYNAGEETTVSAVNDDPYDTFNVSWQDEAGTVYGGQDEVVGGNLTAIHAIVDLESLTWQNASSSTYERCYSAGLASVIKRPATNSDAMVAWAEQFKVVSRNLVTLESAGISCEYNTGYLFVQGTTAPKGMLVYPLATPQTYQLTPQEVDTLVGQNNIWVTSGDVEVTYRIG